MRKSNPSIRVTPSPGLAPIPHISTWGTYKIVGGSGDGALFFARSDSNARKYALAHWPDTKSLRRASGRSRRNPAWFSVTKGTHPHGAPRGWVTTGRALAADRPGGGYSAEMHHPHIEGQLVWGVSKSWIAKNKTRLPVSAAPVSESSRGEDVLDYMDIESHMVSIPRRHKRNPNPFTYKRLGTQWDRENYPTQYAVYYQNKWRGVISRVGSAWDDPPHTWRLRDHEGTGSFPSRKAASEALLAILRTNPAGDKLPIGMVFQAATRGGRSTLTVEAIEHPGTGWAINQYAGESLRSSVRAPHLDAAGKEVRSILKQQHHTAAREYDRIAYKVTGDLYGLAVDPKNNPRRNPKGKVTLTDADGYTRQLDPKTIVWRVRLNESEDRYEEYPLTAGEARAKAWSETVWLTEGAAYSVARQATRQAL